MLIVRDKLLLCRSLSKRVFPFVPFLSNFMVIERLNKNTVSAQSGIHGRFWVQIIRFTPEVGLWSFWTRMLESD